MSDPVTTVVRVAPVLPVKDTFDYSVPEHMASQVKVGCRVLAPFKHRVITGYILQTMENMNAEGLKDIAGVLDPEPLFHEGMVKFFLWGANYYLFPIGKFIQAALPGGLNTNTFQCCELTSSGSRALALLETESEDGKALEWISRNNGKRIPRSLRSILPSLRKRGWITLGERVTKRRAGPLMRQFVSAGPNLTPALISKDLRAGSTAKGEEEFLSTLLESGEMSMKEISIRFPNGRSLCSKWAKKGVVEFYKRPVLRDPAGNVLTITPVPQRLFEHQEKALNVIRGHLEKRQFSVCLLHGVTGSGKTEVYYGAIRKALDLGLKSILMVPEIALSIYTEGIFRSRLGDRVAVYHSGLNPGERFDQWMRMARGQVDLVIGARSALFAPFSNLGLIIVDEEHDTSYKQEEGPRYQARDAAVCRGKIERALVVLGSATPSVQSFHNAVTGKYHLLSLPERIEKRPLPDVLVVDMKTVASREKKEQGIISPLLREALRKVLAEGKQAMVFLNRRGFHRVHLCRFCGQAVRCPNCDVTLIHHLKEERLSCHYCGFHMVPGRTCPSCSKEGLRSYGFGTERLEVELRECYPGCRVARMDRDSTRGKGGAFGILKRFSERELDFLVGTQMITKGYDFPNVTLVGVVSADSTLALPDFRAAERTFQLLSQVAGRAGRGRQKGEVIVQTFYPEHYAVTASKAHDYLTFFNREKGLREQLGYPPFSYTACLKLQGNQEQETTETARRIGDGMHEILQRWPRRGKEVQILGPAEAPIARLKGKYRRQILVKSRGTALLHYFLEEVDAMSRRILKNTGVDMAIDVDPYQML